MTYRLNEKYYRLTTTAKRKNARRHIVAADTDIKQLERLAAILNDKYIKEIYTWNWQLVKTL